MSTTEIPENHEPAPLLGLGLSEGLGPLLEAEIDECEAVIACLGDDAALLRHDNPDCEIAANMDSAADMLEKLREQGAEILMLRTALRQVAHSHAWLAFGECRAFGSALNMLRPSEADEVARIALGDHRQGPNKKGNRPA